MNIFWLDTNLTNCAKAHYDKHIVKMPIEYAQLLSTTLIHFGYEAPYRKTHENHPCAKWARKHKGNYQLLWDLANEVGKEYTHRYGKVHKSHQLLLDGLIPREIDTGEDVIITTPLPNCTSIKNAPEHINLVTLYRMYYLADKAYIRSYKNREEPEWMGDRLYMQQYNVTCGSLPQVKTSSNNSGASKAPTKAELVSKLGVPSLEKLLVKDLQLLQLVDLKVPGIEMPTGRLKAPYVAECEKIHSDVTWSKMTVAGLKEVIQNSIS